MKDRAKYMGQKKKKVVNLALRSERPGSRKEFRNKGNPKETSTSCSGLYNEKGEQKNSLLCHCSSCAMPAGLPLREKERL